MSNEEKQANLKPAKITSKILTNEEQNPDTGEVIDSKDAGYEDEDEEEEEEEEEENSAPPPPPPPPPTVVINNYTNGVQTAQVLPNTQNNTSNNMDSFIRDLIHKGKRYTEMLRSHISEQDKVVVTERLQEITNILASIQYGQGSN